MAAKKKAKKKAAKKVAVPERKVKAIASQMTKTQIQTEIAEKTGLTRKQIGSVFDELAVVIEGHIKKRGAGTFMLPGLLKIKTVKKPARKAQKNVPNPFKPGDLMDIAAKPATTRVKFLPLKKLQDIALYSFQLHFFYFEKRWFFTAFFCFFYIFFFKLCVKCGQQTM